MQTLVDRAAGDRVLVAASASAKLPTVSASRSAYQATPPATAMGAQPVPMGMSISEREMPRMGATSLLSVGSLGSFQIDWQHWAGAVVEPPSLGAAAARVAKPARARVKSLANIVGVGCGSAGASAEECGLLSWGDCVCVCRLLCAPALLDVETCAGSGLMLR
jgi:hypothetical protein